MVAIELDGLARGKSCVKDDQSVDDATSVHLHVAPSDLAKVLGEESPAAGRCVVQPLVNYARCNPGTAVKYEGHHGGSRVRAGVPLFETGQGECELRGETISEVQLQYVVFVKGDLKAFRDVAGC